MARFDWYQATIPAPTDDVLEAMLGLAVAPALRHERGVHGYAHRTVLADAGGPVAALWHGGSHDYPHAVVSGDGTPAAVELIRATFPDHAVTRADACEDFDDADAFDRIVPVMLATARDRGVKVDTRGDHLLTREGRTVYLGAASSACRQRLYDKAAELRARFAADPVRLAAVPVHLTRLEAQVRPQSKPVRQAFAHVEPLAVMGSSAWLCDVWRGVTGMGLQPLKVGSVWRQADDERAWSFLLAQYGALLKRRQLEHGSWACVGEQIGSDLAERDAAKRRRVAQ